MSFTVVSDTLPIRTARDLLFVFCNSNFSCSANLLTPICWSLLVPNAPSTRQLIGTIVSYKTVPKNRVAYARLRDLLTFPTRPHGLRLKSTWVVPTGPEASASSFPGRGGSPGRLHWNYVSRILLKTRSNFVYFALRSWLLPGNIATRLSPWHILSSYCLSTCSDLTRRYTMRYSTIHHAVFDLALIVLDDTRPLPVADNRGLDSGSAWVGLGARRCSVSYSTLYIYCT
jgi:hypothetical protein